MRAAGCEPCRAAILTRRSFRFAMSSTAPTQPEDGDQLAQEIGTRIERARTSKNLSVSELHRLTGISRTVLQGYEAGRYKPGAREIRLLSDKLDCSPNRLLLGREDFRERSHLDDLLGDTTGATSAAKFAIVFQMLTMEEQRAILSLLTLLAEARVGGRSNLSKILSAADEVVKSLEASGPQAEARLEAFVGTDLMKKLGSDGAAESAVTSTSKAPPRRARQAKR